MKRCPKCGTTLPSEAFSPDRSRSDGLRSTCKDCRAKAARDTRNPAPKSAPVRVLGVGPATSDLMEAVAPFEDLRMQVSVHLSVLHDFDELPSDAKDNPSHRRVRLDAAQKVVELLEVRRKEVREATKKEQARTQIEESMAAVWDPKQWRFVGDA